MTKEEVYQLWVEQIHDKVDNEEIDPYKRWDDIDFEDMAIGFMIAHGFTKDDAAETYQYFIDQGKF